MNALSDNNVNGSWSAQGAYDPNTTQRDSEQAAELRHDMVNALTGMRLQLELMRRKQVIDDKNAHFLGEYLSRMELLVQDWRALSKSQQRQPDYQVFNLAHMVLKMVEANRPCATLKRQSLTIDIGHSQAIMIGDPSQIQRALDNIISNAVKYTAEAGTVRVAMQVQFGKAMITVEDDGIGIAELDQPRVFEAYFRADNARSSANAGSGLGLAQVKSAIEQHGGTISLRSVYGQGTRVEIHLPLQVEQRIVVR